METIFKYPLSTNSETELELPKLAEILRIDVQNNSIFLWAKVDPDAEKELRVFEVFGTGHTMPDFERKFINTFFVQGGTYVFHAFERLL